MTKKLVLLRHGQSQWNLDNRFTGWVDVDITEQGRAEAQNAGKLMRDEGLMFDVAHTSVLKRAINTQHTALAEMDQLWIPVNKSWRLNERHYGALQGLDKSETTAKYGEAQVKVWRRSYDIPPPTMDENDGGHPRFDRRYGTARHRVTRHHARPRTALLARRDCTAAQGRSNRLGHSTWQLTARAVQVSQQHRQRPDC